MKKLNLSILAVISASAVLLACASANAVAISFDEAGNGSIPSLGIQYDAEINLSTLTYGLQSFLNTQDHAASGWVVINDIGGGVSDVLHFGFYQGNPENGVMGYVYVYSGSGGDPYPVHAVPTTVPGTETYTAPGQWKNGVATITLTEIVGTGANGLALGADGVVYTPTLGQVGYFLDSTGAGPTYTFTSDAAGTNDPVPDGGMTVGLLGMALVGMSVIRRKLAK